MDRLLKTFIIVYFAGLLLATLGFLFAGSCTEAFCSPWKLALPAWLIGFPLVGGATYAVTRYLLVR